MTLRTPRTLIVLGYLGVVAATAAWVVIAPGLNENQVYNVLTTVGWGLAGLAWWQWSAAITTGSLRRPSRTMALASLAFAIGIAAITERDIRFHVAHHLTFQSHYRLAVAAGASYVVGFGLAAVGFWLASNAAVGFPEPDRKESLVDAE